MHLPRGRFTDALVALLVFAALFVGPLVGFRAAAAQYGFIPAAFWAEAFADVPLRSWISPVASLLIPADALSGVFNLVFLLIAGRFVEKAVGGWGVLALFFGSGIFAAVARLLLTPGSAVPSMGIDPALYGVIAGYFMLYGVPQAFPVGQGLGKVTQIALIAAIWLGLQAALSLMAGAFEPSTALIAPLAGMLAGIALARPLLAWRYRRA